MLKPALCAAALIWANTADACRLALVLGMDVSSSVSAEEDVLQRGGLASALVAPEVQAAFFATDDPVALAIFEWSGRYNQEILQDWVMIDSPATLAAVSDRIANSRRSHNDFPTALGYALGYAATLFQQGPLCDHRTIDISGDGVNNEGFGPEEAYGAFPFDAVTVNGLVINAADFEGEVNLIAYYAQEVIYGPGAFVEIANGFEDFARTMEVKLVRELGVRIFGSAQPSARPKG
ncbi:MAG: DUF1194 domain-containing protein [Octadecabacter sp.]|nr:DUF1194 domain-containing protein [Octadecabacter sp.]